MQTWKHYHNKSGHVSHALFVVRKMLAFYQQTYKYNTVTPSISDSGISENLKYSFDTVQSVLISPTPGLSDTFTCGSCPFALVSLQVAKKFRFAFGPISFSRSIVSL